MKIGFIGFGNMARAMAAGFIRKGTIEPEQICACARDLEKLKRNTLSQGFQAMEDAAAVARFANVVIVAVKPYQVEAVLTPLRELLRNKVVVSVAAGWTFERFEELLLPSTAHLSTMPNTPVAVGEGIVVCEGRHSLGEEQWQAVEGLLQQLGRVMVVDTPLLGIAGTICGCGPAFVSLFVEALADAAVKHGIARAEAYTMVSQMVAGTGKLQLATGQHPGAMKDAVCSPGGTTIIGVGELERKGFRGAVIDAVDAIHNK